MNKVFNFIGIILIIFLLSFALFENKIDGDFAKYYGAFNIFMGGGNPYSPQQVGSFLNLQISHTIWNPPILFFYMCWIFVFPLNISYIFLSTLSIVAIAFIYLLSSKIDNKRVKNLPIAFLSILLFFPTYITLKCGQLSLLLTFVMITSYYLIKCKNKNFLAGLLLPCLLIKGHVFGLYLSYIFILIILEKRWNIILGSLFSLMLSIAFVFFVNPDTFYNFFYNFNGTSNIATVGLINLFPMLNKFRFYIYTVINFIFIIICLVKRKILNFYILLCLSALFMPYGFSFDYTILLPAICNILFNFHNIKDKKAYSIFVRIFLIFNILWLLKPTYSLCAVVITLIILLMTLKISNIPNQKLN